MNVGINRTTVQYRRGMKVLAKMYALVWIVCPQAEIEITPKAENHPHKTSRCSAYRSGKNTSRFSIFSIVLYIYKQHDAKVEWGIYLQFRPARGFFFLSFPCIYSSKAKDGKGDCWSLVFCSMVQVCARSGRKFVEWLVGGARY